MNYEPPTQKATGPDLVILPQAHKLIPGEHLTTDEQAAVTQAWHNYNPFEQHSNTGTWNAHIVHIINGHPTVTATVTLPKRPTPPAPAPATHANNDASTPVLSAPQSA